MKLDHLAKAASIARRMKVNKPRNVVDLLVHCGLTLKYIESGGFRDVYKVVGADLVVKVPIDDSEQGEYSHTPKVHSENEWDYCKLVRGTKRFKAFRPYLPTLHYLVRETGVLLSDYYKPLSRTSTRHDKEIDQIVGHLASFGVLDGDIGTDKKDNYGTDRDGKLRILDLGCFGGELE